MGRDQMIDKMDDFHFDRRRHQFRLRGLCLGAIIILLAGSAAATWALAASGLITVPVISGWAYRPPAPSRNLTSSPADADALAQKLALANEQKDPATGSVVLAITEAELNAVLGLKNPEMTVAMVDDRLEWFAPYRLNQTTFYLTLELQPAAENGRLRLNLVGAKVGRLDLPAGLLNWVSRWFQQKYIDANDIIKQIVVEDVRIENGEFHLRGKIPSSILQPK